MAKPDKAIDTALAFIQARICECGCTEDEHEHFRASNPCGECRCNAFRPVRFVVTREKES